MRSNDVPKALLRLTLPLCKLRLDAGATRQRGPRREPESRQVGVGEGVEAVERARFRAARGACGGGLRGEHGGLGGRAPEMRGGDEGFGRARENGRENGECDDLGERCVDG